MRQQLVASMILDDANPDDANPDDANPDDVFDESAFRTACSLVRRNSQVTGYDVITE